MLNPKYENSAMKFPAPTTLHRPGSFLAAAAVFQIAGGLVGWEQLKQKRKKRSAHSVAGVIKWKKGLFLRLKFKFFLMFGIRAHGLQIR
jgi:hypothetical protein